MIPEEFVTFETAKLLKEAGFPQDIKQTLFYNKFGQDWHMADGYYGNGYAKPSQSQAMRWLREKHGLLIQVNAETDGLYFSLQDMSDLCYLSGFPGLDCEHPTYEAAVEAGIKAACVYLI